MSARLRPVRSGLSGKSTAGCQWHVSPLPGKHSARSQQSNSRPLAHTLHSMTIALFWLGWTVWPSVSPVVPMFSGVLFGCGFQLVFMGMVNYLTDVFQQYCASAHAAASMTRSIGAILLPLAAGPMYANLGVHWAPSILGFVALAMGFIPFIFIRYGDRLAQSSRTAREALSEK